MGSFVAETEFNLLTFKPRSVIVMGAEADHAWTGSCLYVADPRRSEKGRWCLLLVWGSGVIGRLFQLFRYMYVGIRVRTPRFILLRLGYVGPVDTVPVVGWKSKLKFPRVFTGISL